HASPVGGALLFPPRAGGPSTPAGETGTPPASQVPQTPAPTGRAARQSRRGRATRGWVGKSAPSRLQSPLGSGEFPSAAPLSRGAEGPSPGETPVSPPLSLSRCRAILRKGGSFPPPPGGAREPPTPAV